MCWSCIVRSCVGMRIGSRIAIASAAVATSIIKMPGSGRNFIASTAPPGDSSMMTDWIVELMPFTRRSFSSGTICGSIAEIAGLCTPPPNERIAAMMNTGA